jgi:hypothetical protein
MKIAHKALTLFLALALAPPLAAPALAAGGASLDKAVAEAAASTLKTVAEPQVGSVGGEWAVIGLARSGHAVPDSYYQAYYATVERYVKEHDGALHDKKLTEHSRVVLALTAAGHDPRDVAGYDLTKPLEDFDKTVWQGVNGPIWALIALDSGGYPNSQRDSYVAEILRRQLDDGGWSLAGDGSAATKSGRSDPDVTGMALQALSRYQLKPAVKAATDKALACMSKAQDGKGGYSSGMAGDAATLESAAQMLMALCALGIPTDDPRFVKNGNTLLDNILSFSDGDGGFRHVAEGDGDSRMSAEQAFCALVAAQRAADGKNGLYDMSDAKKRGLPNPTEPYGLPGKHKDVSKPAETSPRAAFGDVVAHPNRTAIEALAARAIVNGRAGGTFDPDGPVTRAEFAKMAVLSLGLPEKTEAPFTDVASGAWYEKPVATAYYYEIINGVGDGRFAPDGYITRQDAAVMAARAARLCGMDTTAGDAAILDSLSQFGDYRSVAAYARGPLAFCFSKGILDDSEPDVLPAKAATRAEIAEMLYRLLDKAELL